MNDKYQQQTPALPLSPSFSESRTKVQGVHEQYAMFSTVIPRSVLVFAGSVACFYYQGAGGVSPSMADCAGIVSACGMINHQEQ